jgi:hypothetical protein
MPRPNPPRKRRPPAGSRVRADAQLNKQTAQSSSGQAPAKTPAQRPAKAEVITAPPPDEMWSRRSYAILIVVVAVLELVATTIQWALGPVPRDVLWIDLLGLNPISLLVAAIIAPFIARPLNGERRPLRPVESLMVGLIAYFIAVFVYTGIGFLLLQTSSGATTGSVATPCPVTATCATASPSASPSATARPSASATASASEFSAAPSASPSPSTAATTTLQLTPAIVGGYIVGDIVIYVLTLFIYPPLYKRLRIRRPPPQGTRPQRGPKGGGTPPSRRTSTKPAPGTQPDEELHSPTAPRPKRKLWPF